MGKRPSSSISDSSSRTLAGAVPSAAERALTEITVREPSIARYFRQRRTLFRFRRPTHRQPRLPKKKHRKGSVASRYQATSGSIHRLPARAETEVKPKIRLRIPPTTVRRLAWTDSRVRT